VPGTGFGSVANECAECHFRSDDTLWAYRHFGHGRCLAPDFTFAEGAVFVAGAGVTGYCRSAGHCFCGAGRLQGLAARAVVGCHGLGNDNWDALPCPRSRWLGAAKAHCCDCQRLRALDQTVNRDVLVDHARR
jgi:hypothetical protein